MTSSTKNNVFGITTTYNRYRDESYNTFFLIILNGKCK